MQPIPSQVPQVIHPLLDAYQTAITTQLPNLITACYLHGSLALGAFDPLQSDIDFVALASRPVTLDDLAKLSAIHQGLAAAYPQWALEGCYLQASHIGKIADQIPPVPTIHDGKFDPAGNPDANWVTWWLLQQGGIALWGDDPASLGLSVNWDDVQHGMQDNMNTYWRGFTTNPSRMLWLTSDYGIQWAVLGVLRQYYSFNEKAITSKVAAGEYGLAHLPAEWHRIVQEALNIRRHQTGSMYGLRLYRAWEAWRFLKYLIAECNTRFA